MPIKASERRQFWVDGEPRVEDGREVADIHAARLYAEHWEVTQRRIDNREAAYMLRVQRRDIYTSYTVQVALSRMEVGWIDRIETSIVEFGGNTKQAEKDVAALRAILDRHAESRRRYGPSREL